jgi:DNA-binding NarL/FixJ family response regulator
MTSSQPEVGDPRLNDTENPSPPLRVLIADDHPLLVNGLCSLLEAHGIEVIQTVADGQAAVAETLRLEPDLVLMDIRMPVCDGLTATRLIKAQRPSMRIVMLATSPEDQELFEAVKSGACGYLLKTTRGAALIEALQGLEQGIPPFSPGLAERILREYSRVMEEDAEKRRRADAENAQLTARQVEVLRLVASGLTYKEVGAHLSLSEVTIRYHMSEIMHRLHLENRAQVIGYAARHGLTT